MMMALLCVGGLACTQSRRHHTCTRLPEAVTIDGRLDDVAWREVEWTTPFGDIEGARRPAPRFRTRAKLAWDDEYLYVAAELEEPDVSAALTTHDAVVFHDNDFEVFIDPDGDSRNYYEIEVNALNAIFDLLLVRTYRKGGPALHDWDCAGMRTAVHIDGTLNDPRDVDRGWSVEIALPWTTLAEYACCPVPPAPGDTWRLNMSRVEWRYDTKEGVYRKYPNEREDNWTWSPQGEIDMHLPDRWGYITFSR
ncbi:MAG: carbohydrate-binding family 9-like protein [Phycisphaerales bacterium]|nr:carbohydrate-binding family 9-like protein [Phycisphaerales bacterium]